MLSSVALARAQLDTLLACAGLVGYLPKLVFWMTLPAVLSLLIFGYQSLRGGRAGAALRTLPLVLRLFFLFYPHLTNLSVAAFACFEFDDGASFLRVDVAIVCGSHREAIACSLATAAICLYPLGILLLNAALLFHARHAIRSGIPTPLSEAIGFLHQEYEIQFYW